MKRIKNFVILLMTVSSVFAQEIPDSTKVKTAVDTIKVEALIDSKDLLKGADTLFFTKQLNDSISLKLHEDVDMLDSLWLNELIRSPLFDTIHYVLTNDEIEVGELAELPTSLFKERLEALDAKTPFNIAYNIELEQIVKTYLRRRKAAFSRLMEKARFYFPLFEEQLDKYDIPLEVKYLAIVESALRPRARSRVGAKGLWQFMYQTGRQYDLHVSSYVDDRQDPYKSTEAACRYLSFLYGMYDDWDLALAAYNSGPGNVNKAIRRAGGARNFWSIRHFLPRETSGYVPAFYATLYIFEYSNEHEIRAKESAMAYFETDTVTVKRQITFEQLYETLNVDIEILQFLNPQYKLDIIPFIEDRNHTLTLPIGDIGNFVSNENQIYAYVDSEEAKRKKALPQYYEMNDRTVYRVKSGDYLGKIADMYGVSVRSIQRWNNLSGTALRIGQRLVVYPRRIAPAPAQTSQSQTAKSKTPDGPFTTYIVKNGDSLWLIARKFENISVQNIKDWNNIWRERSLKPGTELKIYTK